MIEERIGNLLNETSGFIVHGCNDKGIMGAGIALGVKYKFPAAYDIYSRTHLNPGLVLGTNVMYEIHEGFYIVNAITQTLNSSNFRQVNYEAVAKCFERLNVFVGSLYKAGTIDVPEIKFPLIGAGLGGGNWNIIKTIIDETISDEFKKIVFRLPD